MLEEDYSLKEVDSDELRELLAESEALEEPVSGASAICERIASLRSRGLRQALPALMMELERTARETLSAEERITVMHCVKKPVLKAIASLPKPHGPAPSGANATTLEQRLLLLMIYNLRKTLHEIDRTQSSRYADDDSERIWVLQHLFRFFTRQIRYGIDWDRPLPQHSWRDLHDLFVYLVVRGMVQLTSDFSVSIFDEDFDAEIEYKRALLLGLADRLTNRRAKTEDFFKELKRWASETRLQDPNSLVGQSGLIKLDVTQDEPPLLFEGVLAQSFRGWVVRPPEAFRDYIDSVNHGQRAAPSA
jgi:hypothetical protein